MRRNPVSIASLGLAMIATACTANSAPNETDVAIVFTDGGCELLKAPRGDSPNSVQVGAKNPTTEDYGIAIVTLQEGATKEDLEAFTSPGNPPFLDQFLTLIVPDREGEWTIEEVELVPEKENFIVCGHSSRGAVAVPVVLSPR